MKTLIIMAFVVGLSGATLAGDAVLQFDKATGVIGNATNLTLNTGNFRGNDPVATNDLVTLGFYERTSPEPVTYFLDVGITATVAYAESGAYRASVTPAVTNAERTISGITNNQYLWTFAFQEPADMMSAGLYKCEVKALDSGGGSGQDLKFTWEGYHWTNGVVQGDFETGANSSILTTDETLYIIPFVNTQSVARAADGAFGIKLRAVVTGTGGAPSMTIRTGPDHLSCVRTVDAEGVFTTRSEFTAHASRHAGAGADPITSVGAITHTGLDSFAGQSATNINVIEGTTLVVRTAATLPAGTTIGGLAAVGSYFPSTYFHVRMTNTTWFCTNGAYTSYKYDTEDADLGGAYSTTTYAYTVPSSGYYSFVASGGASYMTNSYTIMSIYTNGVRWGAGIGSPAAPTVDFPNTRSMVFWDGYLSSGVTVSAWTYLGSDTANRTMHSGVQAFFSGWRMY